MSHRALSTCLPMRHNTAYFQQVFRSLFTTTSLACGLIITALAVPASAHEYYLMPETFKPEVGKNIFVSHRLGQKFKGNELPWVDSWNVRSEIWENGEKREIRFTDGDRPALRVKPKSDELTVVVHQSNIDKLDFRTWEKFVKYTDKDGLSAIARQHLAEGKPKPGEGNPPIRELYSRFAKTLMAPGGSMKGKDVVTGLTIELVALENPMALGPGQAMPVKLLFRGKPLEGATLKVFTAPDTESKHRILTDAKGRADIPDDGPGPYLINAIAMTKVVATGKIANGADWESFWASMTFERRKN
ncbi:MAG: DUF4198 domain-containing protein [Boseongicola sp.]